MLRASRHWLLRYSIPVLSVAFIVFLSHTLATGSTVIVLVLCTTAVLFSAWAGGWGPAFIATFLSAAVLDSSSTFLLSLLAAVSAAASVLYETTRLSQSRLQEQQHERYAVTLASIGDGVIATDAAGRVEFMNAVAEGYTGWTRQEANGRAFPDVFQIINEYTRQPVLNPVTQVLQDGKPLDLANHTILVSRDRREIPIDDSCSPIRHSENGVDGAVLVFRDVSERRRIHESQAKLAAIVESSDDAIISKDLNGIITSWNRAAERLYGYTASEAVGCPISMLIPSDQPDEEPQILARIRRGERIDHYETLRVAKDGRVLNVSITVSPLYNAEGEIIGASKIARDITERKRSEERFALLFENMPMMLLAIGDNQKIAVWNRECERLTGYSATDIIASPDWQAVLYPDANYRQQLAQERRARGQDYTGWETTVTCKDGKTRIISWASIAQSVPIPGWATWSMGADVTALRESENRSRLLMEQASDAIFISDVTGKLLDANSQAVELSGYSHDELVQLSFSQLTDVADPAEFPPRRDPLQNGQAVLSERQLRRKNGSLVPVEVGARMIQNHTVIAIARDITERRRNEDRQRFLEEATAVLASMFNYEIALKQLARLAVPDLADWCSIHLIEPGNNLRRIDLAIDKPSHTLTHLGELREHFPYDPSAPSGIAQVIATGQSIFIPEIDDNTLQHFARTPEHLAAIRALKTCSSIVVAIRARGKSLGVISLNMADSDRHYTRQDLMTAEELARRAGIAIDNGNLYREAEQSRQIAMNAAERTARLQAITAALSEAITPTEIAETIINQGLSILQAQTGTVSLVDDDDPGRVRIIASIGFPQDVIAEWRQFSIDLSAPIADAIRQQNPVWLQSLAERIERYPHLVLQSDAVAWAALPLLVEGEAIGALGFSFSLPQSFNEEDRGFMLALAHHCGQAIRRARLYETEKRIRAEAENAIRARDEFMSIAAHELRTPVTSLRGFTQLVRHQLDKKGIVEPARVQRTMEVIEQQSEKLARLITQLLDISRLDSGRLSLERKVVNLTSLTKEIVMSARTRTSQHAITIHAPSEVLALVDPLRLEQVLANLIDNAIKYSPNGGLIDIEVSSVSSSTIAIAVTDRGIGIPMEQRDRLFERFYQAHSSGITVGGLGLGLYISRQIVELHGGDIHVEFPDDGGTRFIVSLPTGLSEEVKQATTGEAS